MALIRSKERQHKQTNDIWYGRIDENAVRLLAFGENILTVIIYTIALSMIKKKYHNDLC